MPDKARIRRYERMVKALKAAADAMTAVAEHEPLTEPDNARSRLRREIEEYGGFIEQATWWRQ